MVATAFIFVGLFWGYVLRASFSNSPLVNCIDPIILPEKFPEAMFSNLSADESTLLKSQWNSLPRDYEPYSRCVALGNLVLFTNEDDSNYLLMRIAKKDDKTGYQWIVAQNKDTETGTIVSDYYGPDSRIGTKHPLAGPIGDNICTVLFSSEESKSSVFCQIGKFPNANLFIDRGNDGQWDTWFDQTTEIRYQYDPETMSWKSIQEED